MSPGVRKVALTAHIASSVGWLGAVIALLALAIAGLSSSNAALVETAYLARELTGWYVIVPLHAGERDAHHVVVQDEHELYEAQHYQGRPAAPDDVGSGRG